MFRSKTETKYRRFSKLFEWEIDNFSSIPRNEKIESPKMTAIGFDGIQYTAVFKIFGTDHRGDRDYNIEITPEPAEVQMFWEGDGYPAGYKTRMGGDYDKIKVWVDVINNVVATTTIPALDIQKPKKIMSAELKEMWKNDSTAKFIICCDNQELEAIQPIMCARSPVFMKMFEVDMKEKAENRVQIVDFNPQIVQKMIEFCENDTILHKQGFEEDLLKIAHKYEIESLKDFAIEAMAISTSAENVAARLAIAKLYQLQDFEKWCTNFQKLLA